MASVFWHRKAADALPYCAQTTEPTYGPASLMMAMKAHDPTLEVLDRMAGFGQRRLRAALILSARQHPNGSADHKGGG